MRITSLLFLIFLLIGCGDSSTETIKTSKKGPALKLSPDYQNIKAVADAVKSGVIDSCQVSNSLGFDEIVKIAPKMYQMMKHGQYGTKTCSFVVEKLGEIKEWNLRESFQSHDEILKIFRYRLNASKCTFPIELRITLTDQNKLTEYRFYKWESNYSEDLIKMKW